MINQDNKKISYNILLERTRVKLNNVFGMDLVELPKIKERMNQSQSQMRSKLVIFFSLSQFISNAIRLIGSEQTQQTQTQTQQPESSTQAADNERTGTSGTYILRYNMKLQYRTTEIITQSPEEYKQTGVLYVILGLIFLNGQSMTSRKYTCFFLKKRRFL